MKKEFENGKLIGLEFIKDQEDDRTRLYVTPSYDTIREDEIDKDEPLYISASNEEKDMCFFLTKYELKELRDFLDIILKEVEL
jgi:hypothetical protein